MSPEGSTKSKPSSNSVLPGAAGTRHRSSPLAVALGRRKRQFDQPVDVGMIEIEKMAGIGGKVVAPDEDDVDALGGGDFVGVFGGHDAFDLAGDDQLARGREGVVGVEAVAGGTGNAGRPTSATLGRIAAGRYRGARFFGVLHHRDHDAVRPLVEERLQHDRIVRRDAHHRGRPGAGDAAQHIGCLGKRSRSVLHVDEHHVIAGIGHEFGDGRMRQLLPDSQYRATSIDHLSERVLNFHWHVPFVAAQPSDMSELQSIKKITAGLFDSWISDSTVTAPRVGAIIHKEGN